MKDKLRAKHQELAAGIRTPANCTVEQCLREWLKTLNTRAESTVTGYRIMTRHLIELIGNLKLVELRVRDVDFALGRLAKRLSTRSVRLARMILIQAIRNAMVNDLVVRNVPDLAAVPTGKPGRVVYGHQFRPVTRTAAIALGSLFQSKGRRTEAKAEREAPSWATRISIDRQDRLMSSGIMETESGPV